MLNAIKSSWITATLRLNWRNLMANKKAFWIMATLMCLQNLIYFMLWFFFFQRISSLRGWGLADVAFLYASAAIGYGGILAVFGGLNQLASTIHSGNLDVYLARPRSVLLSVMMQRMRADSLGDVAVGIVMLTIFVQPHLSDVPLLVVLSASAGLVFVSFRLILHSLAFWGLGNEAVENSYMSFLIAATNPQKGFGVWGKVILLSVFPAGYVGLLPVEILKQFSWGFLGWQVGASLALCVLAIVLFHVGLKNYASGNRFLLLR